MHNSRIANPIILNPQKRHDFLFLFDVTDGNPNGDPDAGNMPRVDPETGHGLVTDVCLKRKVRNFVALDKGDTAGYGIYVRERAVLSQVQGEAYLALGLNALSVGEGRPNGEDDPSANTIQNNTPSEKPQPGGKKKTRKATDAAIVSQARSWMCQNFYDIRAFGAVMSLKENNAGQVRGPLQLTFARSFDPITPMDVTITRMAVSTRQEAAEQGGANRTMGRKSLLPYALYMARGFFTPAFAQDTGVTSHDLALFWRALEMMWDIDRSATRGFMACRGLYIWSHDNPLGNAPAQRLFEQLRIKKAHGVEAPRQFGDYTVFLRDTPVPGVTVTAQVAL